MQAVSKCLTYPQWKPWLQITAYQTGTKAEARRGLGSTSGLCRSLVSNSQDLFRQLPFQLYSRDPSVVTLPYLTDTAIAQGSIAKKACSINLLYEAMLS